MIRNHEGNRKMRRAALVGLLLISAIAPLPAVADALSWSGYRAGHFDDGRFDDECHDIAEVRVRAGWWVDAVQVVCRDRHMPRRGGPGGGEYVFRLLPGEYLIGVTGTTHGPGGHYVYALQFHTNLRSSPVYGEFGPQRGMKRFRMFADRGEYITGFSGLSGSYLMDIGIRSADMRFVRRHAAPHYHDGRHVKRNWKRSWHGDHNRGHGRGHRKRRHHDD